MWRSSGASRTWDILRRGIVQLSARCLRRRLDRGEPGVRGLREAAVVTRASETFAPSDLLRQASPSAKNILLNPTGKSPLEASAIPTHIEGRFANRHERGGG